MTVISGLVAQRLQGLYKIVWGSLCSLFLKWDGLEKWVLSTPWMRLAGEMGAVHSVNEIGWRGWLERWVLFTPWMRLAGEVGAFHSVNEIGWRGGCFPLREWDWLKRWVLSIAWMRLAGEVGAFHSMNEIGWRGGCFPFHEWDWLKRWVFSIAWMRLAGEVGAFHSVNETGRRIVCFSLHDFCLYFSPSWWVVHSPGYSMPKDTTCRSLPRAGGQSRSSQAYQQTGSWLFWGSMERYVLGTDDGGQNVLRC